jgi:aminoglycoside phosphotransferase
MLSLEQPSVPAAEDAPALSVAELIGSTARLRSVVVGVSKDPNAKVTVLLVSERDGMPVMAVKVPTTPIAAAAVESERAALVDLRARFPGAALETIPRVVRTVEMEGLRGVVMTAVPGTPMTRAYMCARRSLRGRTEAHLGAVSEWLSCFHSVTAAAPAGIDMDAGVASGLRTRFGDDERLPDDLARLAAIHAALGAEHAARTVVHGDLWFGNVLVGRKGVTGVVDWEAACLRGEPVRDLARFAIMYALYLDHGSSVARRLRSSGRRRSPAWGAGIEFALNGTGWFPELFRGFLQDGLRRLGASPAVWREAALAGLADVAARTDDPGFGRSHLELFRRLTRSPRPGA